MARIAPGILVNGSPVNGLVRTSVKWAVGAAEQISYTAQGAAAVAALTPGQPPQGTRLIGITFGAGGVDTRMLSGGTQANQTAPADMSESGSGAGQVLMTTFIDRLTAQQIRLDDVFNGTAGTVITSSGRVLTPNGVLPNFVGLSSAAMGGPGDVYPNDLNFNFIISPEIAGIILDIDSDRDTVMRCTQAVTERLGSYIDPQRAQFWIDSGDFGADGSTRNSVNVGLLGTTSRVTFVNYSDDPTDSFNTVAPIRDGTQYQPQTLQKCRLTSFQGGQTSHGMPDNGNLTDVITVNHNLGDATGNYRSGMPVFAFYGDRNNGGVYYSPGDNALHPMSQAMGVRGLWYDNSLSLIYAATDAGVYQHSPNPQDPPLWARLGGMALKVHRVLSTLGRVYALVEFPSNSTIHVLMYAGPGTNLPTPDTGKGYDGWVSVYTTAGLADFTVITSPDGTTTLYAISDNSRGFIIKHVLSLPGVAGTPDIEDTVTATKDGSAGVGIDSITGSALDPLGAAQNTIVRAYIRTDSGVVTTDGSVWSVPNDINGNPVQVNHIYQHSPGRMTWDFIGSVNVALLIGTSAGVFASASPFGGSWIATDGQSNIGDTNIARVASAPPQSWLGQMRSEVWAIAGRSIARSPNGTLNWIDFTGKPLDGGPAFFAEYKRTNGVYPGSTVNLLHWPPALAGSFNPGKYNIYRGMNPLGEFTYHMTNPNSTAPAGAHRFTELSENSTPSQVREVRSSALVFDAMARFLAYTEGDQIILEIESRFHEDSDPLRFLRPTHMSTVDGTIKQVITGQGEEAIEYVTYAGLTCFVLEHTITWDAEQDPNTAMTLTKLGILCLDDRSDPSKVDSDLWGKISRMQIYNQAKH